MTTDLAPPTPVWQRVRVGDREGYYASLTNGTVSELWVVFEDGVVLRGGSLPRERLIAAGDGVERPPGTEQFKIAPPPGFEQASRQVGSLSPAPDRAAVRVRMHSGLRPQPHRCPPADRCDSVIGHTRPAVA